MSQTKSRSYLIMIELAILSIFFVVSLIICVLVFVSADNKNKEANDLNQGVINGVTVVDTIKSQNGDLEKTAKIFGVKNIDKNGFTIYYKNDWSFCTKEESNYYCLVTGHEKDNILVANIVFREIDSKREIYSLKINQFTGGQSDE
ncbi:MAG: hypothetical protein RSD88_03635 [Anaerovoracaceae bacterium]